MISVIRGDDFVFMALFVEFDVIVEKVRVSSIQPKTLNNIVLSSRMIKGPPICRALAGNLLYKYDNFPRQG